MTPQKSTTAFPALKIWQRVRNITGLLVVFAGIATVVTGLVALRNERDTWSAMKLPVTLAFVCLVSFVHAQKKILAMRKKPNQMPEPTSGLAPGRGSSQSLGKKIYPMKIRDTKETLQVTTANLSRSEFTDVNLQEAQFTNVNLSKAKFTDINFSGSKLSNLNLTDVEIDACETKGMKIRGVLVADLFDAYKKRT